MFKEKIIIAIDGYSSTGKSSFAKSIAAALGYLYIDSGALYRAITLFALREKWMEQGHVHEAGLQAAIPSLEIRFAQTNGHQVYLNGEDVSVEIRSLEVSAWVSVVSALPFVREYVDKMLQHIGREKGIVMDGRDIGTVVFPDAELKIFMTAKPEIRAQRRYDELLHQGAHPSYQEILDNIQKRDYLDQYRSHAPLRRAADALLLDNSELTPQEQMQWLAQVIQERWG